MSSMVPLPAKALVYNKAVDNADLLKRLMIQLERKKASGYLLVKGKETEGYLFFQNGKVFNARFSAKIGADKYIIGTEAARTLNNYCCENAYHLSVYILNSNAAGIVAGLATGRDKHKRLSTEFVNILKFTQHLVVSAFDGYMHVCITTANRCAICAYTQGRATGCILYPIEGFEVMSKLGQWPIFLSEAQAQGAIFSVFESVESHWRPVKFGFTPTAQTHMHLLDDIFTICDDAFSNRKIKSNFEELFVDACIQITDQYPFMHPFDNEVRYEQGKLDIGEDLEFTVVLRALNAVLKEVFRMAGNHGQSILAEVQARIEEQIEKEEDDELKKIIDFFPLLSGGGQ